MDLTNQQFENNLYDLLVSILWKSDEINLPEKLDFEKIETCEQIECFICFIHFIEFNKMNCCNKMMCEECTEIWFKNSVTCPFCNQDIRNFF